MSWNSLSDKRSPKFKIISLSLLYLKIDLNYPNGALCSAIHLHL